MATTDNTLKSPRRPSRFRPGIALGLLALFAPISYLAGRLSTDYVSETVGKYITSGLVPLALGMMIGIPVGLFFGTLRSPKTAPAADRPNTRAMEHSILEQLRAELAENRALFEARKGSLTMFARIDYISPFWDSVKASGRLFVMPDQLLSTIATAYYWLDQATHLEKLAYEAKYAAHNPDEGAATADHLIGEARLLDGQIEASLDAAIDAVDRALTA